MQNASVERFAIGNVVWETGPISLLVYAEKYRDAAIALEGDATERFNPVRDYAACHALELALKAFLSLSGYPLTKLAGGAFGHDLEAVLAECEAKGLDAKVTLEIEVKAAIRNASRYYLGKVLEYPALVEAVVAYPGLPQTTMILPAVTKLIESLRSEALAR